MEQNECLGILRLANFWGESLFQTIEIYVIKVHAGAILSMNQRAEGQANLATTTARIDKDSSPAQ